MPTLARRHRAVGSAVAATLVLSAIVSCGGGAPRPLSTKNATSADTDHGVEVHDSGGRPRVLVVRRDGDPASAVSIEVRIPEGTLDAGARTAALSALIAARLSRLGVDGVQPIAGAQFVRVRGLVPQLGDKLAAAIDEALSAKVSAVDPALVEVRRALDVYAARPIDDPALSRAARCLDRPTRSPTFVKIADAALATTVEGWRASYHAADAIVLGVVGGGAGVDAFLASWSKLPAMPSLPVVAIANQPGISASNAFVSVGGHGSEAAVLVIEDAARAATPAAIDALADANGPLTSRLRAADEWRLKGVSGAARAEGGCLVIELEPSPSARAKEWNADRVTMRTAVALEVARQEVDLALEATRSTTDAEATRLSIARGGDARETADRAAWWGWSTRPSPTTSRRTFTLIAPLPTMVKGTAPSTVDVEALIASLKPKLDSALDRARVAWAHGELDVKGRLEAGQGELWALLGSSCGVSHETGTDAGLSRVAMTSIVSASAARATSEGVAIEPWSAPDGVGLVAHAATRVGESSKQLAERVGAAIARAFLASFPSPEDVAAARASSLVALAGSPPPGDLVHEALRAIAKDRPSWLDAEGVVDAVARIGGDSVDLRLATLRGSTLRLALLANADAEQIDVAARAADRWTPRRPGETRACPVVDEGAPAKGGIHAITVKYGTGVAFAFPVEASQRDAMVLLAAALDGPGGRLDTELAASGVATSLQARLVRGVGRSALVVVALAPDSNLDLVVAKLRALLEQLRAGGVRAEDLARAEREVSASLLRRRLEPRARAVDLFVGDLGAVTPPSPAGIDLTKLRAVAAKVLDEDRAQLVVARTK